MFCFPRRFHSRDAPPPAAPPAPEAQSPPEDVRALFSLHEGLKDHIDEDGLRRCLGLPITPGGTAAPATAGAARRCPLLPTLRHCLGAYQGGGKGQRLDDDDDAERLLEQIRGTGGGPRIPGQQQFTLYDFHRILFSHDFNPPIRRRRVHHDMTLPLSHYFIYSAHNPYYATPPADQRRGSGGGRSDEPIIKALKMGVRAIEVAMWPNSKEDDIKIHHGWTQNKPVLLTECLKSIKENAFVASRYPVIITLEDNLQSSNLQKKAAKVLLDVLGHVLYWPHADYIDVRGNGHSNNKPLEDFPSPDELMGAVLLSTKPPSLLKKDKGKPVQVDVSKVHGTIEQGDDDQLHVGKGADDDDDDAAWGPEVPVFQTEKIKSDHQKRDGSVLEQPRRRNDDYDDEYPLYRHLITIRPDNLFPRGRLGTNKTTERVSTLEMEPQDIDVLQVRRFRRSNKQQIEEAAEYRGTDIVRFTQRNLLRIYPSVSIKGYPRATRVTSSNYNPFLGWVHGAQMVALNMQEYGRALWLMHGFYRANGGCGYVRKPDFLMQTKPEVFDPRKRQPVKKTLKVKVYMGDGWRTDFKHAHTSFIPDLWASVGITGVPADTTAMQNTEATEKTWAPVWEDEEFSFDLRVPEIALLRVEVHQYDVSDKDVFGGQTVLPVWELRPGIRAVALFDRQGNRLPNVKLLMRFEFV